MSALWGWDEPGERWQDGVEGGPGWVAAPLGPSPTPSGSRTIRIPSAGPGTYSVRLFHNNSDPAIPDLVPAGGIVIAEVTVTVGGPDSHAVWSLANGLPPDQGISITGDAGLLCGAGTYGAAGPPGGAWPPCRPCPRGAYSAGAGAAACLPCAYGKYNAATGRSACDGCPAAGASPPAGSPFLEPGNEDACAACPGLPCCGKACLGITAGRGSTSSAAAIARARTTTPARGTTPPQQASGTMVVTSPPSTSGEVGGGKVVIPICGDGLVSIYPTACWTNDRGGARPFPHTHTPRDTSARFPCPHTRQRAHTWSNSCSNQQRISTPNNSRSYS